jgi:hypothetical protein
MGSGGEILMDNMPQRTTTGYGRHGAECFVD